MCGDSPGTQIAKKPNFPSFPRLGFSPVGRQQEKNLSGLQPKDSRYNLLAEPHHPNPHKSLGQLHSSRKRFAWLCIETSCGRSDLLPALLAKHTLWISPGSSAGSWTAPTCQGQPWPVPVLETAPRPSPSTLLKVKQAPMPNTARISSTCPGKTRKMHHMGSRQVEEEV